MARKKLSVDNEQSALELLDQVKQLAKEGSNHKDIAKTLGFKSVLTLSNWLVKASQITRRPVPDYSFRKKPRRGEMRVEFAEVRRRGKGSAFGMNIPMEPLIRAGMKPGDKIELKVRGKRISLMHA